MELSNTINDKYDDSVFGKQAKEIANAWVIDYLLSLIIERHNEVMPNMRLPQMEDLIHKNIPFVAWTALMAMEHIGHDVSNKRNIWIEPIDYARQLEDAIPTLAQWRKEVAVYNVPLYLIPESIHPYVQKCISDWKNKFLPECEQLSLKSKCCGIFVTSQKPFNEINPII